MINLKQINGNKTLNENIIILQDFLKDRPIKKVVIIKFDFKNILGENATLPTEISTKNKLYSFQKVGFDASVIQLPFDVDISTFAELLFSLNNDTDVIGILIQHRMPSYLLSLIKTLNPQKDIDGISKIGIFKVSAVSESAIRIFDYIYRLGDSVAIVGANGYVGKDISELLYERNIDFTPLDIDSNLSVLSKVNIVISAVGKAGIIDQFVNKNQYIIDIGFSVEASPNYQYSGDVSNISFDKVTPVPNGLGPLSIATLIERIAFLGYDFKINSWTLKDIFS